MITGANRSGVSPAVLRRWTQAGADRLRLPAGTISIAWVTAQISRTLNHRYRRVDRPTNILSFRYESTDDDLIGELILCPPVIRHEVPRREYQSRVKFLLQHGLIHLLGLDHQTIAAQRRWIKYEQRLQS